MFRLHYSYRIMNRVVVWLMSIHCLCTNNNNNNNNNGNNCFFFVDGQRTTVGSYIQNDESYSMFKTALDKTGYTLRLRNNGRRYTVFAPNNDAISKSKDFQTYLNVDVWLPHLRTMVQNHIVAGSILMYSEIFDNAKTFLQAEGNQIVNITQGGTNSSNNRVNNVAVPTDNGMIVGNGIIYPVTDVLLAEFQNENMYTSISKQMELVPSWLNYIDMTKFYDPLKQFNRETGATFIAPRNQAINGAFRYEDEEIVAEYNDVNKTNRTYGYLEYSLLDTFIDQRKFDKSTHMWIKPRNNVAHMLISRDRNGVFRFNDAKLVRDYDVLNGIVYITESLLAPPGITELIEYAGKYTSLDVGNTHQYLAACEWNPRNITADIVKDNTTIQYHTPYDNFTMFVPIENAYRMLNLDDITRLATLLWQRHTRDFVGYLLYQPALSYEELFDMALKGENNETKIKMVNNEGENTLRIVNDRLTIVTPAANSVSEIIDKNIKGVDGSFHIVTELPLAPSVRYSNVARIKNHPNMTNLYAYLEVNFLTVYINNLSPLTYFAFTNEYDDLMIPGTEQEFVLRNHAFRGLLFTDVLKREFNGKRIQSENGAWWTVDVFNDTIYLDYNNPYTNVTVVEGHLVSDVLSRTGVVHQVTGYMVKKQYPKAEKPPMPMANVEQMGAGGGGSFGPPPVANTPTNGGGGGGGAGVTTPATAPASSAFSKMLDNSNNNMMTTMVNMIVTVVVWSMLVG